MKTVTIRIDYEESHEATLVAMLTGLLDDWGRSIRNLDNRAEDASLPRVKRWLEQHSDVAGRLMDGIDDALAVLTGAPTGDEEYDGL